MNFLQKKIVFAPCMASILFGLAAALLPMQVLMADELKNVTDFRDCRAIKGKTERLSCYDTIVDGGIFNEEALQQVRVENFGSKEKATKEEKEAAVDNLSFTVVRIQKDGNGVHYFQTSEGQVWKQVNTGSWSSEVPFEAVISTGALGSFFLANERGKSTRVKRVR
jgi:hypothetical protein